MGIATNLLLGMKEESNVTLKRGHLEKLMRVEINNLGIDQTVLHITIMKQLKCNKGHNFARSGIHKDQHGGDNQQNEIKSTTTSGNIIHESQQNRTKKRTFFTCTRRRERPWGANPSPTPPTYDPHQQPCPASSRTNRQATQSSSSQSQGPEYSEPRLAAPATLPRS